MNLIEALWFNRIRKKRIELYEAIEDYIEYKERRKGNRGNSENVLENIEGGDEL